jgi:hypothetical protein
MRREFPQEVLDAPVGMHSAIITARNPTAGTCFGVHGLGT